MHKIDHNPLLHIPMTFTVALLISLVLVLTNAGCRCPWPCGSGYSKTQADCHCWCQKTANNIKASPDVMCTFLPVVHSVVVVVPFALIALTASTLKLLQPKSLKTVYQKPFWESKQMRKSCFPSVGVFVMMVLVTLGMLVPISSVNLGPNANPGSSWMEDMMSPMYPKVDIQKVYVQFVARPTPVSSSKFHPFF
ncbi:hypothetical protein GEMRC1_000825 [Eukaryota sp. GEM-RC1]